jgi:2',3'-cyclic-nucleotide 2'-phosphodiesterase (5'-nucleotidase family)
MKFNNFFFPFLLFLFLGCKTAFIPAKQVESRSYSIKDSLASDTVSAIEIFLKPYRDSITGIINEVVGVAEGDFHKEKGVGSLGNLIADALYETASKINHDCIGAIFNSGGIRIPDLMKGNITKGKLLELLPFDNEMVILEVRGDVLEKWMNTIGGKGGWPIKFGTSINRQIRNKKAYIEIPAEISIVYKNNKMVTTFYDTTVVEKEDGGIKFQISAFDFRKEASYRIATNDYIANGGDNCDFLKDQKRINTGLLIRNIVNDFIKKERSIKPDTTKRIIFNN